MLQDLLSSGISENLIVLLIAALPISELRGAIPVAIGLFHFSWYYALVLALIGNMLPVPFILLFLRAVSRMLCRIHIFKRFFDWLFEFTKRRGSIVEKYKVIGLIIFVAIPLPTTGAWTASLIAVLLNMKFWQSFLAIGIGVVTAGVIVTCLTLLGWIGATIAGIGLIALAAFTLRKARV